MPISRKNLLNKRQNSKQNQYRQNGSHNRSVSKKRKLSNKSKLMLKGGMKINIKKLDQTIIEVDVDINDSFSTLKQKIMNLTGIPVQRQRLVFGGYQLLDHQTLFDYNVHEGNTIHLIIKSEHPQPQPPREKYVV
jgi:hypothetical protein